MADIIQSTSKGHIIFDVSNDATDKPFDLVIPQVSSLTFTKSVADSIGGTASAQNNDDFYFIDDRTGYLVSNLTGYTYDNAPYIEETTEVTLDLT